MIEKIYFESYNRVLQFCNKLKIYQLVALGFLITLFAYFPDINKFDDFNNLYHSINQEIDRPFDNESYYDETAPEFNFHTEKRKFRLLIPLLARTLHLRAIHMIWLQFLLLPVFLYVMYKVFKKITEDHITSVLLVLSLPFFYVADSYFWVIPIYDGYGYLLLALLFLVNNKFIRYLILVAVCFSDERAIISSGIVYMALMVHKYKSLSIKNIFSFNEYTLIFIAGWLTCFAVRFSLNIYLGISIPAASSIQNGILIFANNYKLALLTIFLAFEGFWIVILTAIAAIIYTRKWFELFIILLSMIFFFSINLMVYDLTRSFGYCYTFIFLLLLLLKRFESISTIRNISFITLVGCFLIPTMSIYSNPVIVEVTWLSPIIPKILHFF